MTNVTRGSAPTGARGRGNGTERHAARGGVRGPARGVVAAVAGTLTLSLAACGTVLGDEGADPRVSTKEDVTIGLLLPEKDTARYEKFDRPVIEQEVRKLTHGKGTVVYANAEQHADRQATQFARMIDQKVDAVLIDAVDARAIATQVRRAKDAGIHVIAYDRLAEGPVDGYVTFDGSLVGQVQGQALGQVLDSGAKDRPRIVMMNGAPNDPNSALFKRAALIQLRGRVTISASYDVADWKPENARAHMAAAIKELGPKNIDGVYSANDGMAGGVVEALKAAGVNPLPPITGQDADLPAVQRIVSGEQYMTVYKPYREEAEVAARMAVKISQRRMIEYEALALDETDSATAENIPSHLVPVRPVTKKTIKSSVVRDRIYTIDQICTRAYEAACREAGLT